MIYSWSSCDGCFAFRLMIFPEQELNMLHCKDTECNFNLGPTSALNNSNCILESYPATLLCNDVSIAAGMLQESFKK